MTANVKQVLQKIYNNEIFNDELYFTGGTALAYYLNHRISEDIDIVSSSKLNHIAIISQMSTLGATKIKDEHETTLRMAGLFPDEYMIKFVLDDVKVEFFQANRPIQQEILSKVTFNNFEDSTLKILDVKSVAKLKIIALIMRDKSRDLFDFWAILEHNILSADEIIELFSKVDDKLNSLDNIINFIDGKTEPHDDEAVYLSETDKINLTFKKVQNSVIKSLYLDKA